MTLHRASSATKKPSSDKILTQHSDFFGGVDKRMKLGGLAASRLKIEPDYQKAIDKL